MKRIIRDMIVIEKISLSLVALPYFSPRICITFRYDEDGLCQTLRHIHHALPRYNPDRPLAGRSGHVS